MGRRGAFVEDVPLRVSDGPFPKPSALAGVPAGFGWVFSMKRGSGRVPGETRTMGSIACEMVLVARGVFEYSVSEARVSGRGRRGCAGPRRPEGGNGVERRGVAAVASV